MNNFKIMEENFHEIDLEKLKIRKKNMSKNNVIPEYFRSPLICLWEITRACNFHCIHCYNNSDKELSNELSHNEKLLIAHQIVKAKIYKVCLSGGEPILCKSFWDIAKILNDGHVSCNTITNGWYISEEVASKYTKYFKNIQISIDGFNPDTHDKIRGKKGSWKKALNASKLIIKNNGLLSIAMVVMQPNCNELGDLIDFSYHLGAKRFRIDFVNFVGRAAINYHHLNLSTDQYNNVLKTLIMKKKEYNSKEIYIDISPKYLYGYYQSFLNIPTAFLYISPSGICAPDPCLPYTGDSLKKKTLEEAWNGLKKCYNNKDYIKLSRFFKTREDFLKLKKIPYVWGELHDE